MSHGYWLAEQQFLGFLRKKRVHNKKSEPRRARFLVLAEWTGLEPATPGVTGRYSNQLNYHSSFTTVFRAGLAKIKEC
jgi:hypothetical protein